MLYHRELAARLEACDVIVYIALDPLMRSSLAGKLTWMAPGAAQIGHL